MTRKTKTTKKSADAAPLSACQREANRAFASISSAYACLLTVEQDSEAALCALMSSLETIENLTGVSVHLPEFCSAASILRMAIDRVLRLARMAEGRYADAEAAIQRESGEE